VRRRDQRPRAGHRHRRSRRRGVRRLPRLRRWHLAALRSRGPARQDRASAVLGDVERGDRSVPRVTPSYLLDGGDRRRAHRSVEHRDPHPAPEVRGVRAPFVARALRHPAGGRDGDALRFLADHGVVHEQAGRFHWATDAYPANHVSLRSVGWDNFVIIDDRRQDARRARLARDAHDAPRAGHLPARRRAVPGREARLREPQGLRAQGRPRLLHDRAHQPQGHAILDASTRPKPRRAPASAWAR
jgi:hypothetical protein